MAVRRTTGVSEAQLLVLRQLTDGCWHLGSRAPRPGAVLSTPAAALAQMGLVERSGASRTASTRNPGFSYRILPEGMTALIDAAVDELMSPALHGAASRRRGQDSRPVRPTGTLDWWGSECVACENATYGTMLCDSCGGDEHTVRLWVERPEDDRRASGDGD